MDEHISLDEQHPVANSVPAEHDSAAPAPKRRKLRKGTASCWECKRRKAKCIFSDELGICDSCKRRGTDCVSQESEKPPETGSNKHIVDRLGEVEALVQHLLKNTNEKRHSQDGLASPSSSGSRRRSEDRPRCSKSPTTALGTNVDSHLESLVTVQPIDLTPPSEHSQSSPPNDTGPYDAIYRDLTSAWPSTEDMEVILSVPLDSSQIIRALTCAPPKDRGSRLLSPSMLLRLPPKGSHPVLVARKMLILATFLQGVPISSERYLDKLTTNCESIMSRIVKTAHDYVTSNDDLVSSLEGIECIMLEGLYENYAGNLRRSWLAARRAVMIGQMLGLDRGIVPSSIRGAAIEPDDLWFRLVNLERYLCLMLGLPTSVPDEPVASLETLESYPPNRKMQHLCSIACAQLLKRKPSDMYNQDFTKQVDKLLRDACTTMPAKWWIMPNISSYTKLPDKIRETLRWNDHFMQYHLLLQLHLPYLFKIDSGDDYGYNKLTAITASREILTRFISIRTVPQSRFYCRGTDLTAFISCAALTIGHILCDHRHKRIEEHDYHFLAQQRLSDRGLVEQVLAIANEVLSIANDDISKRIITLLHYLLAIEDNVSEGVRYTVLFAEESIKGGDLGHHVKASEDGTVLEIHLPHLPVIKIVRRDPEGKEKPLAAMELPWGNIPLEGTRGVSTTEIFENVGLVGTTSPTTEQTIMSGGGTDMEETLPLPEGEAADSWTLEGFDLSFLDSCVEVHSFI